jgi:hypothetical protein
VALIYLGSAKKVIAILTHLGLIVQKQVLRELVWVKMHLPQIVADLNTAEKSQKKFSA